ncbi:Ig-like domain-containing protein [Maricaulis sp.]|uniref:Ig-like domain-containing protein n=1 Tax=Maricaulis sp. TaxID=1486257 RepID=UPI00260540ED|nr:Ig-like domain-containing protein [Maricaulis sp.]
MLSLDQFKAVVNSTGKLVRSVALAGATALAMASGAQAQDPDFVSAAASEFPTPDPNIPDIRPGDTVRIQYQFLDTGFALDFADGEFSVFLDAAIPLAAAQAGTLSTGACDLDSEAVASGSGTIGFSGLSQAGAGFIYCTVLFDFTVPASTPAGTYSVSASSLTGIADPDGAATPFTLVIPDVDVVVVTDTAAPNVSITGPDGPVSAAFNINVGFIDSTTLNGEAVNGFDVSDLTVTNATVALTGGGGGDGGGAVFSANVEVTPTGGTPITVELPAATVTDLAGNDNNASNLFSVAYDASPPVPLKDQIDFTAEFIDDPIAPDAAATLRFTLANNSAEDLSNGVFSQNLTAAMSGASSTSGALNDMCGTGSSLSGTTFLIAVGLNLAAGDSCSFDVVIDTPSSAPAGVTNFATSALSLTLATSGGVVDDAVAPGLEIAGAEGTGTIDFSKAFTNDPAEPGDNVTLEFTISAAGSFTTTGLAFTDDLDAVLSGLASTSGTQTDVCGVGSSLSGTSTLTLTGGNLGQDESCTFSVTVAVPGGATVGDYVNTTSNLSATRSDVGAVTISGATDTLSIQVPAPTSRIEGPSGPLSVASNFNVDLLFSEDVTGVDAGDFTLTGVTLAGITPVSAAEYTVALTPTGVGTAEVQYNAAGAQNGSGADNTASNNFTVAIAVAAPEATTLGLGVEIANGDATPGATDGTFIGTADVASGTASRTFTIRNDGTTDLTVGTVTLTTGTDFSITSQPSSPVAAGNSTTFEVTFDPTAIGSRSDTLSFATNDADENPYTFGISGSGVTGPEINVVDSTATLSILNGDATPASADGTDFGSVNISGATPTATFIIQNTGSSDLTLGANAVTISGSTDFTVTSQPASTIAAAGTSSFVVTFDPSAVGPINASVSIANNDTDENPYIFGLTGSGFDNEAPSGFTVAFDATGYGPSNYTNASFTLSDPERLTDYAYSISSSGGGTPVTGTGTLPAPASPGELNEFDFTGLDLSGLSEGTLTVSLTLTDPSGNTSSPATDTAPLDLTQPSVAITNGSVDPVSGAFTATFTFSESVTGFVVGDITAGNAALSGFSGSGDTYTATVTPSADGAVTLDVAAGVAADQVGNTNTAATQFSVTNDETAPTVIISSTSSDPVSGAFTATFTFSESVTGFVVGDITLGNAVASGFSGSGDTYSATITPSADGAVTVDVAAAVAQDAAGNDNTAATQFTRTNDETAPDVSIATGSSDPVSGAFTITVTFTESVTGFVVGDLTVGNGAASGFSGSGDTYTATITPSGDGQVSVDINAGVATDAAGNGNTAATQFAITNDETPPSVAITTGSSDPVSGAFTATFTFSESVTGFVVGDITLGNAAASGFSGSGDTYTATITPAADGAVTVDVAAGVANDGAGNGNTAATQFTITNDETPPTVTVSSTATGPTNSAFTVDIVFSESVADFVVGDITASAELTLSGFSGSGTTYSVTATPIADGAATVDVNAGAASDAAGNGNTAATQFTIDVDVTAPTGFTVGFTGLDTPSFNAVTAPNGFFDFTGAETGTTYNYSFTSDSGGSPVTGSGTVTSAGQNISPIDLSGLPDGTLTLSVTLTDAAGNVSTAQTATAALDQDGPSVAITGPTATQIGAFTIDVVFSEAVTGFEVSDLTVGNGAASGFTGSGTTYQATITPAADGNVTVDIALGAGQDAVSNPSEAATQFSVAADITPPTVAFTGPTAIQSGPFTLTIDFSEDVTGFAAIDVDVINGVLSAFSGSGDSWTAEVTPTAEGTLTVDIPAGRLTDIAGNSNTAASQFSVDTDLTPPDVIIASVATGVQTGPFDVSFTFSEAVTGFELADITVGNGAASAFTGSGTTYGATITPAADGAVTVDVAADVATDGPGNGNTAATQFSLDADVSAPTVVSVVASDALLGVADVGTPFTLAVTFSEAMDPTTVPAIDFGSDDLSGTLTFTSGAFSSGDTVYTATYAVADNGDNITDIDVTVTGGADANGNAQTDGTETDIFSVDMRRGTVTIATSITGAADGTFDYTGDLGDFSITTVAQAGSSIFSDLAEGSYAVVLDDFGDFTLDAIMCTGGSTTVDTGTGTANITLSPADSVTCDFEFTADPKIDETAIPDVEITFASLTDDPTTESTTFSLDNTGGAAFFFTAATDQPWLTIDPTSGSIPASGSLEFTVSFTAAVLDLAPGTYSANITITEVVPSGQEGGLAKANTLDTIVIPVTITLEPREGSLTIVATTAPSIAGEGSFSYASDITAVNGLTLNTSNGTASSAGFTVLRGTYAISQAANAEWDLSAITCTGDTDGGNVVDLANGTITIDLDPEETMVCTFANVRNEAYIQEVTLSAIRSFMAARADQILTNSPRLAQRMRSGDEATTPNHFSADFRDGRFQANFSTSLNAIRAANEKSMPQSDVLAANNQGGVGSTDIWFQATYSSVDDNRAGLDAESDFGIYYLGADMMVSEDVMIGALIQWDTAETVTGALRSRVEGDGWMAGPYMVARLSENLYFDARGAYGQSENQVNPIGTYWDDFETDRWLLEANLTGDYFSGGWRISPEIGLAYFTEEQSAYTDSLGFTIPSQDITIGRLNFGPEFAYRMDNPNGGYFEPYVRVNGVWDYDDADVYNSNGVLTSLGDFRADARLGFNAELSNGGILSGEVSVQGLGESDLEANSAMVRVRLPLSMQ